MKDLRLAHKILAVLVKDRLHYPGKLVAEMATIAIRFVTVMLLYAYVYHISGGSIRGLGFQATMWSIFFYYVIFLMNMRAITRTIIQDVKSGAVETFFSKPVSYLWYRFWWQAGSGIVPCVVIGGGGALILAGVIGLPASMLTASFVPTFVAVFALGVILIACLYTIIGLLAFWMEDADPVFWIVDKLLMLIGGSYVPVAMMPHFMQLFAAFSPFGAGYFLSHTAYESWANQWSFFISMQLVWIIVCGMITLFMFNRAKKRVSVNGG